MEGLHHMLRKVEERNWVRGFKVSSGVDSTLKISHLKYADDIMVFCEANLGPIEGVIPLHFLARIIGGKVGVLPTEYLRMPLGAKSKYVKPTYLMSLFPIPVNVSKKLDSIRRNFFYKGNSHKKKTHQKFAAEELERGNSTQEDITLGEQLVRPRTSEAEFPRDKECNTSNFQIEEWAWKLTRKVKIHYKGVRDYPASHLFTLLSDLQLWRMFLSFRYKLGYV
ncbi:hypothetical protein H5410_006189 [Solanum commersonii]|uniref:Reverse transcriptase domain-containing protein n=1 Tax=Solanum commersonii TaxID=4109 RepID=A0A9J6A9L6_SOLCO|nr:hypothetical protein H5410_006189 [Solanum commersonii]